MPKGPKRVELCYVFVVPQPILDNKHTRSCFASRRSVSGWELVAHGARALQPNKQKSFGWVSRKGAIRPNRGVYAPPPPPRPPTKRDGVFPSTQWLSLPLDTPEGAWSLSKSTWVQRKRKEAMSPPPRFCFPPSITRSAKILLPPLTSPPLPPPTPPLLPTPTHPPPPPLSEPRSDLGTTPTSPDPRSGLGTATATPDP